MGSENLMENLLKNRRDYPLLNYFFNCLSEEEQNDFTNKIRYNDTWYLSQ